MRYLELKINLPKDISDQLIKFRIIRAYSVTG